MRRLEPDDDRRFDEKRDRQSAPPLLPLPVQSAIGRHINAHIPMCVHRDGRLFWFSPWYLLDTWGRWS